MAAASIRAVGLQPPREPAPAVTWMSWLLVIAAGVVAAVVLVQTGRRRWRAATRALVRELDGARRPSTPPVFDVAELNGLPPPVQRYFRVVLQEGQPLVSAAHLAHRGTFNVSESSSARWRPFTSAQYVTCNRPGFVWDARIAMLPGVAVCVHDAYAGGEGSLTPALFGLFTLGAQRGTPQLAQGELLRYLAEAVCYPTALLPSQGVRWRAVNDACAEASLEDGATTATLRFQFDAAGYVASVHADARARLVDGAYVPTRWQGHWRDYQLRDGMRIPMEGEVAWELPQGPSPYWRGRLTSISFDFAS